jgi:NifB/MoaA-like Fe-S oxidoreductase
LNTVTSDQAREITRVSSSLAESTGFCQIYCADELFILAGEKIPPRNYYDDFCQIENGIGMVRALLNNWNRKQTSFMQFLANNSILLVTGKLAEKYLREIAGKANRAAGKDLVEVLAVENEFLGKTVTVSGLLTCQDIVKELQKRDHLPDYIGLSSNMFNTDGYTLDGISKEQIGKLLQRKIVIINELWTDWTLGQ